ncbi:MAG TPA: cupin domain-containing protein [Pseudogracilibacillus sp.]|nr:cupin domain-containing protein [Pseudogracilibacillus sp.]
MKFEKTVHNIGEKRKHADRVLNEAKFDMIQIHMKEEEVITSHHAKEETLIIVRSGKIVMNVEGEEVTLTNESVLQMDPYEAHDLRAIEETDLILLKLK